MPVQVKRLLIAFSIFIIFMIMLTYYLTPESWREYGPYRGLALPEIAGKEAKYVQTDDCAACHDSIAELKFSGVHKTIECEICHGPGYKHIEDESNSMEIPAGSSICMRCHTENAASPQNIIKQVDAFEHSEGEDCISCHNPHQPWL